MRFALNLLHTNLYTLDLHKFLLAASAFFERDSHKQTSPAFSLTPEQTWVPAIFELGLAFRAIRLNFDPFEYWSSIQTERISEVSTELETERNRLAQESRAIEIRQKVLDEWEKEVIRQRGMAQNFSSVKSEIARELNSVFQAQIVSFQGKLKSTVSFYFRLLLLALAAIGYILYRIYSVEHFSPTTLDGIVAFIGLVWIVAEKIFQSRRKKEENVRHAS